MFKSTAVFPNPNHLDKHSTAKNVPPGFLLINDEDEIIYANKQARHFLGLLSEETVPSRQKFLPLVQSGYQCYPGMAWLGWPKRPSATTSRYLIYSSPNSTTFSLLKVDILEQMILDGQSIWVISMSAVTTNPFKTKKPLALPASG